MKLGEEGEFENAPPPGLGKGWKAAPGRGSTPAPHWSQHLAGGERCLLGGGPVLGFGWGGREGPDPFLAHLHRGLKSNSVEMVCAPGALTFVSCCWCQALPSFPMLCSKGRSASCQGLEAYQKCIRRNTASGKWSGAPRRKDLLCSFLPAGLE